MNLTFKYIKQTREIFTQIVNSLSIEQLNKIPAGFSNNIVWNFGHIIVSTPGLCYLRTGVDVNMDIPFVEKYRKGSKPDLFITAEEIDALKELAISSIDQIALDLKEGKLNKIAPFATSTYHIEMHSIEEVITCSLAHDNWHLGYAIALRKALN